MQQQDIALFVINSFTSLAPKRSTNTVLSAFVIRNKQTHKLTLCSLATGTKAIPYSLSKQYPRKLMKDMHAQILAQKGFKKFIAKQNSIIQNLFILDEKRNKLEFNKENFELIFYSSQSPCGDCSIQQSEQLFSGARPLKYFYDKNIDDSQKYSKNILRTKPSRLDLPVEKRSLCLCCSDKIMLWNVLGVQGKKLFKQFKPIYIDKIIIQKNTNLLQDTIKQGLSLVKRIQSIKNRTQKQIITKLFKLKINNKFQYFTHQFKCHNPQYKFIEKKFNTFKKNELSKQKQQLQQIVEIKQMNNDSCMLYSYGEKIQYIAGKTGLLQGASIKNISKNIGISNYSSFKLTDSISEDLSKYQYKQVKQQIKLLFGMWTDNYK